MCCEAALTIHPADAFMALPAAFLLLAANPLPRLPEKSSIHVMTRVKTLTLALILAAMSGTCGRAGPDDALPTASAARQPAATASFATTPAKVNFDTEVRPLLESRCTPCHFAGGKVYERLPFDRQETIKKLGTKLFTRIKDEKEQRLIREFLSQ